MEAFQSQRSPSPSIHNANTQLQFLNFDVGSPFPTIADNHSLHPQFIPSSPSPDMQKALELYFSGSGSRDRSSSSSSLQEGDVFMADGYLDYVNEILMTEEEEEPASTRDDSHQESYHGMMRSLYNIIGEPLPLESTSSDQKGTSVLESYCSSVPPCTDEIYQINSLDAGCDTDLHNQTINSCGEVSSFNNSLELPVIKKPPDDFAQQNKPEGSAAASSVDISFEELKVQTDYARLYVGTHSLLQSVSNAGKMSRNDKENSSRKTRKSAQGVQNGSSVVVGFTDLKDLLVTCAAAVAMGSVKKAEQILHDLRHVHGVSAQGNSLQRIAHYFCDALVARIAGAGGYQYRVMRENMPSEVSLLKASRIWYQMTPMAKITNYFADQNILKVAEGASKLHILNFGLSHGMQWPCLINALADREGGPPLLVVTDVTVAESAGNCLEKLQATGRRLAAYACRYSVPFQFHPLVLDNWESVDAASLQLQDSGVLVINCTKFLSRIADESGDLSSTLSPRQRLLMAMHSLNPQLLLTADYSLACSSPFFLARFREALNYHYLTQDMLDTVCIDDPDRLLVEQKFTSASILNIVACEGAERVERPVTHKDWDKLIRTAGFALVAVSTNVLSTAQLHVKQYYHSNFMVLDDSKGWMLIVWKGRVFQAMSAWKPSHAVS